MPNIGWGGVVGGKVRSDPKKKIVEKRPQWDDRTNMFLGACQEHRDSHKVPLEFVSEKELEIFCNVLDRGKIHVAYEVSCFLFVHTPSKF